MHMYIQTCESTWDLNWFEKSQEEDGTSGILIKGVLNSEGLRVGTKNHLGYVRASKTIFEFRG